MRPTARTAADGPVLVVTKTFPKLSETFILEELLGLEAEGVDLHVVSLRSPTDRHTHPEVAQLRAPVHRPPSTVRSVGHLIGGVVRHPWRRTRAIVGWSRHPTPNRVEVLLRGAWLARVAELTGARRLHSHFIDHPTSVTQVAATMTGLPFSVSAHAKDIYLTPDDDVRRKLGAASFVVTCTEHNRDHLASLAPAGATIERVHHGVAMERFSAAALAERDPGRPVLLAVGRLRPKKGFDLLLRAGAVLLDEHPSMEVRIVGYGPEEARLRALADQLGIAHRVRFLGKLTRPEVVAEYAGATMLVQPCRITEDGDRDGIPNVVLEAMASGVPVVSTAVSGIPEVVADGRTGLLVAPDDADALLGAMRRLVDDRDLATAIARRARHRVRSSFDSRVSAASIARLVTRPRVAYVLKGHPRLSELFISSEIHRVEQLGVALRLFVIKPRDEEDHHEVVDRIVARPEYLPAVTSLSGTTAPRWLRANLRPYAAPLLRIALRRPAGFGRAASAAGREAWRARRGWRLRKVYLKELFQAAAVADGLLDDDITHLHAHFSHGATTVAWLAALMIDGTYSFTAHAKDIYEERLNPAGLLARKVEGATFVATCTEANRRHLVGLAPRGRVRRIYHGLNADFVRLLEEPAPSTDRVDEGRFAVLAVGRLVEKKGFDVLIRATGRLVELGIDVEVEIVGPDDVHGAALRSLVEELGLTDRVTFAGPMAQRELLDAYRRSDVLCLPCRVMPGGDRDGIPNVLMEALAAGVPVVTTAISGIPELVEDRVNGLLVEPDDVDATAKALFSLADDRELGRRLGTAGRLDVAVRFDARAEAEEMVALLSASVAHGRRWPM